MTTIINAAALTDRLTGANKTLEIKLSAEQDVIKENLKNSVKLQLAIAYLFHDKDRVIGDLTINVASGTITERGGGSTYTINDSVLDNNIEIPITGLYQTQAGDRSRLYLNKISPDGNFYDGFFSMFDGKATPVPAKKTTNKRSKKGGKKL